MCHQYLNANQGMQPLTSTAHAICSFPAEHDELRHVLSSLYQLRLKSVARKWKRCLSQLIARLADAERNPEKNSRAFPTPPPPPPAPPNPQASTIQRRVREDVD